jgi:aryl-alcohol dehydrogenase-like predicted oxidoreductase
VTPIVGATRPGHAIDAAAAVDLTLTAADLAELAGEPSPVPRP